jgi:purine-nucleoside phosphorylase
VKTPWQCDVVATPHIAAAPGDFAELVLLPGDPRRARYIAERHLDGARLVTSVRDVAGFTGSHRGRPVSVMGTGMGIPSISIYAQELAEVYGCRRLVRVGSCGALRPEVGLHDLVAAIGAGTDSGVNRARVGGHDFPAVADYGLLAAVAGQAVRAGVALRVGTVFSTDLFYRPRLHAAPNHSPGPASDNDGPTGADGLDDDLYRRLAALGVLAVEMEAAGLYGVAAATGTAALTVCTVSDHLARGEHLSADERETGFDRMIGLVLDALA